MKKIAAAFAVFTILLCLGLSGCSGTISGSKDGDGIFGKPDAPTGVNVTATVNPGSIQVSWSSVSGASSYNVYRSTSASGAYSLIRMTSSSSVDDSSYPYPNTLYYYRVSAVNSAEIEGDQSSTQSVRSAPDRPAGVTAEANSGSIQVSWSSVSGASSYRVYRNTSASGTYSRRATAPSSSFNDTVAPGITYYYRVSAVNSEGAEGNQSLLAASAEAL